MTPLYESNEDPPKTANTNQDMLDKPAAEFDKTSNKMSD